MSARRLATILRQDLSFGLRRPLFVVLMMMLLLTSYGLSSGNMSIASGDSSVGGTKAWITSQFAAGQMLSMLIFLNYSFFIAVAAGMAIIRDDELKIGEVLHATGLTPGEYVWGKFLAVLSTFFVALTLHLGLMMFFNHLVPSANAAEMRGPFALGNYVVPAVVFGLPTIVFLAGCSFFAGERSRRPILVFVLPVAALLLCAFFLWNWAPSWLDPRINKALMLLDPAGFRWLNETWLKLDRGVDFYNKAPISFDAPFLLSRAGFVAIGLLSVALTQRGFRPQGRIKRARRLFWRKRQASVAVATPSAAVVGISTTVSAPGFWRGSVEVARTELRELRSQAGLYIFVPMILLQTIGTTLIAIGPFDTPILATPGTIAVRTMNTLSLLVCLLLLFYTVESLERERATGLSSIFDATAVRSSSVLFGKALANSFVGIVIVLATLLAGLIVLLVEGKVPLALRPFLVVWGLCLVPTFLLFSAFVTALHALTRNRYATYALAIAAVAFTGYRELTSQMNWVGNWDLWGSLLWTDMGTLELDRRALILSRIMALGLTAFFIALTVRLRSRVELDATRTLMRLRPAPLARATLGLAPFLLIPALSGGLLFSDVYRGFQGKVVEKKEKDYWRKNVATYTDAPVPAITRVEASLDLAPERRWFHVKGTYALVNHHDVPMASFPVTSGLFWQKSSFTMNGESYKPEDRAGLLIFKPPAPLAPGESLTIGFDHEGTVPTGATENGGGNDEFILPSGIVITSFSPSVFPVLGYMPEVGIDKDNRYDSKEYADDFYKGVTDAFVSSDKPFAIHLAVTAPESYTCNGVGTLESETVKDGRKTSVWVSDHPVSFFNVVAGRWQVKRGEGTALYYDAQHPYNVDEMVKTLDAARRYYSEWFYPYPWKELKVSEFPALARYAQGFPTNITFSESIGFLAKDDPKVHAAFVVTAHESAHQWWGSIVTPGKGPGGNILAEGMAHFSTILLMEKVKGARDRMEFCKRLEERYGDERQVDSERPLVKVDGSRPGDTTTTYDKGGWVAYMLLNRMGRDNMLHGIQELMRRYEKGPDHAVLQDYIETLRPFAPDPASFDDFVKQWYFDVVVPEYRLSEGKKVSRSDGGWDVTVKVENAGSGSMPVEVSAERGERFPDDESKTSGKPVEVYRDARATVVLGKGEAKTVTISCNFEPKRVVTDPDVLILQLQRKKAKLDL